MNLTSTVADQSLREAVEDQLTWDTEVDASMIGVSAKEGVVALTGYVPTYSAKLAAERTTRRVFGVKAVANDVEVKLPFQRIDPDIAKDAIDALRQREGIPVTVEVTVRDGQVVLSGTVAAMYQKTAAERAVRYLKGVRDVVNNIVIKPAVSAADVKTEITKALRRNADLGAQAIKVVAEGSKVTLTGSVHSWADKQQAERAAWNTAGVSKVEDFIVVAP